MRLGVLPRGVDAALLLVMHIAPDRSPVLELIQADPRSLQTRYAAIRPGLTDRSNFTR
ncbi:Hypothetical protein A7982_05642 [Minicystis rosea]|nr:Hypothetical protein A7982_05642 [Minicystis rosea]